MTERLQRCMVCAKEKTFSGTICEECKAMIRGEAAEKGKRIRKEAEQEIRREGVPPKK
jgi:predicted amidophosphoribosyltransferase